MNTTKTVVGYCEPFSVVTGESVRLMVSSHVPGECEVDLVRLRCGDPHTGLDEVVVPVPRLPATFPAREQPLHPGSHVVIGEHPVLGDLRAFRVRVRVSAWRPADGRRQALLGTWDEATGHGWALFLDERGAPCWRVGARETTTGRPLTRARWTMLEAGVDEAGLWLRQTPLPSRSPAADLVERPAEARDEHAGALDDGRSRGRDLLFAAWWGAAGRPDAHFDGRLEAPEVWARPAAPSAPDRSGRPAVQPSEPAEPGSETAATDDGFALVARWDFAAGIGSTVVHDTGPWGLHGRTEQCPARAVTGSTWDGSVQRWTDAPQQYAAIHFHADDLVDAGWSPDVTLTVPDDLPTGLYCFRVRGPGGDVDRSPFVVRPAPGAPTADVLFLVPTATYLAYANHRMTIEGSDFFPARSRLRPEFQYIRDHPEVGLSMYEYHGDGSGVMYSSRRRPVLNLKPGADGWAFTADTNLVAFLERWGRPYHLATDEDLHREGADLLRRYRVVVSGTHPEYTSTAMLDALEDYLAHGGRLMYLGGNGFYWRVAFHPEHPGVMEVRRAEDGTRGWIAEPGEYYHEWGAEYGGLWRRLGRPPNLLVGVGFAAQGFDRAAPYKRTAASHAGRAAWIFDGVESEEVLGDYGVGGGAAGQEIDRYDERLGSPSHAVVLAYSDEHSPQMLRTKEELLATRGVMADPKIRSDMVFFECPEGGAVFSVGSISWFGALAHNDWDNDVCRITTNVLDRFADPAPFPPPE